VFVVKSDQGDFVLRIPIKDRYAKQKIESHAFAFSHWRKVGVPVPKTIKKGEWWLLEEKVKGEDWEDSKLSKEDDRRLAFELGKIAKKMHSVKVKGFGEISNGRGKYVRLDEDIIEDFYGNIKEIRKKKLVSKKLIDKWIEYFESNKGYLDEVKGGRLIHCDLTDDNIMVENGKISGIIDGGDVMSGDPYYELGIIYQKYSDSLVKEFFRGYGKVDMERVRFYAVYYLAWSVYSKKGRRREKYLRKLRGILG
jgi:aminoglycoside phosphotransferase (APT) family kinase protein